MNSSGDLSDLKVTNRTNSRGNGGASFGLSRLFSFSPHLCRTCLRSGRKMGQGDPRFKVKSGALHDKQKSIQWMTHTPSSFYTEEDCSYFALVLIPRDEIWWVPVSEVAGKKSICTNAAKDVLHKYRGNLGALKAVGHRNLNTLSF